jgi:hypothetical protein
VAGLVSQPDLLGVVQDEGEKPEGERDHEPDSAGREERNRLEKPDEAVLKTPGTGDGSEENGIAEEDCQAEERQSPEPETFFAYRKPGDSGQAWPGGEKNLKKKEDEEKDYPSQEVPEKGFEGQAGKGQKPDKKDRVKDEPFDLDLNESRGNHQKAEKLASGIPAMKNGLSGDVVKNYSLSHDVFFPPRIA